MHILSSVEKMREMTFDQLRSLDDWDLAYKLTQPFKLVKEAGTKSLLVLVPYDEFVQVQAALKHILEQLDQLVPQIDTIRNRWPW